MLPSGWIWPSSEQIINQSLPSTLTEIQNFSIGKNSFLQYLNFERIQLQGAPHNLRSAVFGAKLLIEVFPISFDARRSLRTFPGVATFNVFRFIAENSVKLLNPLVEERKVAEFIFYWSSRFVLSLFSVQLRCCALKFYLILRFLKNENFDDF